MYVIGIDPDSVKHGVAIYRDGELFDLCSWDLMTLRSHLSNPTQYYPVKFSIEDVCANNFVYSRNVKSTKALMAKMGLSIGRCQQAQTELMRMLDYLDIPYELHKPQKGNWAKNKAQFEKVTGWTKRSNEDNRSAAFFGYLALKNN